MSRRPPPRGDHRHEEGPPRDPRDTIILELDAALEALMEDAGGEPRKRDPDSAAAWEAAQEARAKARAHLQDKLRAPGERP